MWIPTGSADYIVYRRTATATAREVTIGHQLGHLLLDHSPRLSQAPAALLGALVPSVTPELASRFLTRTGYQDEQEARLEVNRIHSSSLNDCVEDVSRTVSTQPETMPRAPLPAAVNSDSMAARPSVVLAARRSVRRPRLSS